MFKMKGVSLIEMYTAGYVMCKLSVWAKWIIGHSLLACDTMYLIGG
jgi:hypothetical protein